MRRTDQGEECGAMRTGVQRAEEAACHSADFAVSQPRTLDQVLRECVERSVVRAMLTERVSFVDRTGCSLEQVDAMPAARAERGAEVGVRRERILEAGGLKAASAKQLHADDAAQQRIPQTTDDDADTVRHARPQVSDTRVVENHVGVYLYEERCVYASCALVEGPMKRVHIADDDEVGDRRRLSPYARDGALRVRFPDAQDERSDVACGRIRRH